MEDEVTLVLEPKLVAAKQLGAKSGLHLLASFCGAEVAIALGGDNGSAAARKGKKVLAPDVAKACAGSDAASQRDEGDLISFASLEDAPAERRRLHTAIYTVWTAVQRVAAIQLGHALETGFVPQDINVASLGPPTPDNVKPYHELAQRYLDAIAEYVSYLESQPLVDARERHHGALLHHVIHLAQLVYIPADGRGDSVVGEELLDWVNRVNLAPRHDETAALRELADPFRDEPEAAWDHLYRCVLRGHHKQTLSFLALLHDHDDGFVAKLAKRASAVFAKRPRSMDVGAFPTTNAFVAGCRQWRQALAGLQRDLDGAPRSAPPDVVAGLADLVALALGDEDRILARCQDYGWQDALGAWVTLVRPAATRDDLPEVLRLILDALPIDPTDPVDGIYTRLLSGNVAAAVQQCQDFDAWLATHLTDLLDKLRLIDQPVQAEFETSLRDYLTLGYADVLRSDPGLWRLSIDYLATCGPTGRARMRPILLALPFRESAASDATDDDGAAVPLVRDVLEICAVHGLEDAAVAVCRIAAEHLVRERHYGRAVAYCVRAGDPRRIARIADRLLDEYLDRGPAEFARLVDAIPSSLLHPAAHELRPELFGGSRAGAEDDDDDADLFDPDATDGDLLLPAAGADRAAFAARLVVLGRLRDFLAHRARGELRAAAVLLVRLLDSGIAPRRVWAALLVDAVPLLQHPGARPLFTADETYELLRCLEEVAGAVAASGRDSAGALACLTRRSKAASAAQRDADARAELLAVRRALAANLARCFVAPLR